MKPESLGIGGHLIFPLCFRHVLVPMGLGFKLKRKKLYVMFKNLETPAVECLENGNYHVYRKLFHAKQHFLKWTPEPENCKHQKINRIKSKKINRTLKCHMGYLFYF